MIERFLKSLLVTLTVMAGMTGCGSGGGTPDTVSASSPVVSESVESRSLSIEQIDDESFNALSEEDRIYVAKKLYATLYKGFDLGTLKQKISTGHFISDVRKTLSSDEIPQPDLDKITEDDYEIDYSRRDGDPLLMKFYSLFGKIGTSIYYTRLSRSYYNEWMAYILDQTILFSPAWEVESVYPFPELISHAHDDSSEDSGFYRLKSQLDAGKTIKTIAYEHMVSIENWARFRSPEDNGREMLEIWLYDYNDSDVPLAAKALQNWKWVVTREQNEEGVWGTVYHFYNDRNNQNEMNNEDVELLGTTVVTGEDFYRAVVNHKDFLPGVVGRIVNLFFPTFDQVERDKIVEEIVASNPVTFKDIFDQILFSKRYLFESDRIKTIEEIYFGLAHTFEMELTKTSIRNFYDYGMKGSRQRAFFYKLGREDTVPSDTDSVIRMHQFIRSYIFLNTRNTRDDGWSKSVIDERYDSVSLEKCLNDMFLDIVGRKMSDDEAQTLMNIAKDAGIADIEERSGWNKFAVMLMTFDYFSRLSEIYVYRKVDTERGE